MNVKKIFWHFLSGQVGLYPDNSDNTTGDGEQLFDIIGDSNSDGASSTRISVPAGTLYNWDGAAFDEITTESISDDGISGNVIQQFSIDYKANTGRKILVVNGGRGGSNIYPAGALDEHWMGPSAPTGIDLWTPHKVVLDAALANKGLTKPKAFFIVGGGINDFGAGTSLANFSTGLDALITNITTAYPGVPILYSTTGVTNFSSDFSNDNLYGIRNLERLKSKTTTDVHNVGSLAACIGPNYYEADTIHLNENGLGHIGSCYARWFKNLNTVTNKVAREIISSHFDDLSSARKTVINTAIETLGEEYWKVESWNRGKTTVENNFYLDWTMLGLGNKVGSPIFSANSHIGTDGVSAATRWTYTSWDGSAMRSATKSDFIEGVELLVNNGGGAGSNQFLFGALNSGVGSRDVEDTFSGIIRYRANDNTQTTGATIPKLEDNSYHLVARNAGDKSLLIDTTVRNTTAVAVVNTVASRVCSVGAISASSPLAATYNVVFKAKYVGFDLETFLEVNDYISNNW